MARRALQTDAAPKAIGPYVQGVQVDGQRLTFLSGQIPLDPATGELVGSDAAAQTDRVMRNLEAVLRAGGLGFENVVRCTIFLTDLADFGRVNEAYGKFFTGPPPARATVQVSALPRGAKVEIDAIAVS